ncbi:MAG: oligosaccharide flippase family protein [Mycobacterium sp.]|nr:oligosaccharide flippase family protein [Mycobacterium sp.]
MPQRGRTGRAAATYVVLAALQRGISLLILPFVTHAMTPVEYGAASMLSAAALVLTAIVATPLIQLIIRAAARGEADGPALLRVTGIYCYLALPVTTAIAAGAVALFVPEMLGVSGSIWAIELLAIGLQPATYTFALWVAQAREDLPRFVWLSSSSILLGAAFKVAFVVVLEMGVLGWALSDLLGAGASAAVAMALVRLPRAPVDSSHLRYALKFSLPLVPHSAALWALTSLSRPVMAAVSSLEQVGLLSFALNLAMVSSLVLAETNRAVLPRFSRETFPAPTDETLGPVRWQLVTALLVPAIVGAGVAATGPFLFAAAYWPSFAITGILLLGQAAYGLYLIPMNYLTQTAGLPKYSALASGAGATVILVSILVLGRTYGALGVAFITAAGYVTMATVAMALTRAHQLDIAWRSWALNWPDCILAGAALACSVGALVYPVGSSAGRILTGFCLTLALGAVLMTSRRKVS